MDGYNAAYRAEAVLDAVATDVAAWYRPPAATGERLTALGAATNGHYGGCGRCLPLPLLVAHLGAVY